MLREFVKNKELMKSASRKKGLPSHASVDSDASEGSTLVSTTSDPGAGVTMLVERKRFHLNLPRRHRQRITHHTLTGGGSPHSDSASDTDSMTVRSRSLYNMSHCLILVHGRLLSSLSPGGLFTLLNLNLVLFLSTNSTWWADL